MKKKLIRRLRILFIVLFFCSLGIAGLIHYAYQHSFTIPDFLINRIRDYSSTFHNIDFKVSKARFLVSRHTIKTTDLVVQIPGKAPFIKVQKADVYMASGTGILDYFFARAVIERVELAGVTFDVNAQRPVPADDNINPLKKIPASEVKIDNLQIKSSSAVYSFPEFSSILLKNNGTADLNAKIENGPFGGKAKLKAIIDLKQGQSRVKFLWKHGNLAMFTPLTLAKHFYDVEIGKGKVEIDLDWTGDLVTRLKNPAKNLNNLFYNELKGNISLVTDQFSWTDLQGRLKLDANRSEKGPWNFNFDCQNREGGINAVATWPLTVNDTEISKNLAAIINVKNFKPTAKLFDFFSIDLPEIKCGNIDFSGKFSGSLDQITGSGSARLNNWKIYKNSIDSAALNWELDSKNSLTTRVKVSSDAGSYKAKSSFSLKKEDMGQGVVSGSLESMNLDNLKKYFDFPLEGTCSGEFKLNLDLFAPQNTEYYIDLLIKDAVFFTLMPRKVSGTIKGKGKNWVITNPVATFAEDSFIKLDGTVGAEKIDADVEVKHVALAYFGVPEQIASGSAYLKAKASGSLEKPEFAGSLFGTNLSLMQQNIDSFKANLKFKDKILDLSPLVITPELAGMIDGFYSLNLSSGKTRSFKFNFQGLAVEFLKSLFPDNQQKSQITGNISGSISFNGQKEADYWDFFVDGRKLELSGHELDTVFLEGSIWGNQGEIRNLFIRAFGGKIHLKGQVLGFDQFDGSVKAESIYLDRIDILNQYLPAVHGEVNCQGDIEWDGSEKKGYFTLFGDKIRVGERDLGNLGAEVVVDNRELKITRAEFDKLGVSLDGNISWAGNKPYQADLRLEEVDLSFLSKAHGFKGIDYGGLVVDGQCLISGDLASLTPDVIEMQLDSIKIQKENNVIVSNRPMQLKYQNNNLEVRSLELKYRQGILGVEGTLKPGEETALMIKGRDFSVKALGSLFDLPQWGYDGELSLDASIFGRLPDLNLRADAEIKQFDIQGRKIPSISARVSGDTRQLEVEKFKVQLPQNSFNMKGKLNLKDYTQIENIQMDLNIPQGPLSDLPDFLPSIFRQASGTIKADLKLEGNPASPQITGALKIDADELGISGMRKPFNNVKFALSTNDNIINIDQLEGKLGRGTITGDGQINFRDGPGSITAKISGNDIDFSFLNFEINRASASFDLGGNLYNPEVYGDVFVPRGKFLINTDLLKDRPGLDLFFNSLKYKINVEVPRNFWLESSFLNAEMRGKFSINGDLENINLDGGISTVQGWLFFQRRKFRIDTGEIKFGGVDNTLDPQIFIKSEGRVQNTQVYLTLQGRVSSFKPKIYSSPPMSEADLLAMLTFGRDLNSTMESDSGSLFENEILEGLKNSYISALIGTTISTALNLDELFLTSLYDKTEGKTRSFIRAGKYIGNNIFMAYEGTLDEKDEETFIFEYRLPRGFVINLEFEEPEKDKRIGVRYDWKFW
jgi:autotransporter translocation and assembly factor TamB